MRAWAGRALERGLYHPLRLLPSDQVSAIGAWLGREAGPRLYPAADRRARAALARLRPDLDPEAARAEAWANIGATFAEMAAALRFWREGRIGVEGEAHLRDAMRDGPVLLAGLHTGNPELLAITAARLGARPAGIAARQPTGFRDRVVNDLRRRAGCRPIPASRDAMRDALAVLRGREEVLVYFMDDMVGGEVRGPSLGRGPRRVGNIPFAARLARLTGCALVPGHVRREVGARFTVRFLPPVALPAATGDRAADQAAGAAALDAVLDPIVRAELAQWLFTIRLGE